MNERELLVIAVGAALKAGKEILEVYHSDDIGIQTKRDDTPLTLADQRSNAVILACLEPTGIPVLSEESLQAPYELRRRWNRCWIIDPLDGTKEFIKRNGEFTVNIALVINGEPALGVIFTPVTGGLYLGSRDTGGRRNVLRGEEAVHADPESIIENSQRLPVEKGMEKAYTVVASRSHRNRETEEFIMSLEKEHRPLHVLSRGSSLKICMVAEGTADIYPRFAPTMEWDTAAGHAIAKHSGCSFTNPETCRELSYNKENLTNPWFIVNRNS